MSQADYCHDEVRVQEAAAVMVGPSYLPWQAIYSSATQNGQLGAEG